MGDDRAHIAGQKILVLANTEHERTATARADDEIGDIAMNQSDAVGADDLLKGGPHGVNEARFFESLAGRS